MKDKQRLDERSLGIAGIVPLKPMVFGHLPNKEEELAKEAKVDKVGAEESAKIKTLRNETLNSLKEVEGLVKMWNIDSAMYFAKAKLIEIIANYDEVVAAEQKKLAQKRKLR